MKTLALRIYLTVVAVLLIFALVTGWLAQHNLEHERTVVQSQSAWTERAAAWGELLENSLPPVTAPKALQAQVFLDWADRLRLPMALESPQGERIATSALLQERLRMGGEHRTLLHRVELSDGRSLWMAKRLNGRPRMHAKSSAAPPPTEPSPPDLSPLPIQPWLEPLSPMLPPWLVHGAPALILSLILLFVAVALSAWPVAHRLTRRLQALRQGVEVFGSGQLHHRVAVEGRDEVATLARSFNEAAQRIEDLITSNRSLLANASHELRSPLARLKMAVSIMADLPPERAAQIKEEIHQDIRELDALVEEVLLASRIDARHDIDRGPVDLVGLVAEEASRVGAEVEIEVGFPTQPYSGDDRLLRRAARNLLENARRYGGPDIRVQLTHGPGHISLRVNDRGPGVSDDQRERIFEPFYRLPGHAEHAGGVGLGLSLVRQIAVKHGGQARCEAREGGGSCFVIELPTTPTA
ncbi:MAG: HAMP domain-containing histidine kinase [Aquabacterium sp.]|jgi:signal transduction histidine kinase|uniref:sensor histidine kinase n=1 Tax=Aquabacterium sp. TaxID=1872578 RepID=UPI001B6BEE18|nr:HAMP domain-containing sensor histidine kinase [Aquabacterium sp.]MBP7132677.1 HAMP domain-containing histidine kinase [Aquabacterium sp.]